MTINGLIRNEAHLRFHFFGGDELVLAKLVSGRILNAIETGRDRLLLEEFVAQALKLHDDSVGQQTGLSLPPTVSTWSIELIKREFVHVHAPDDDRADQALPARSVRRIERCRSILKIANRILPTRAREDAFDEWMDDVETAAENELPVFRRAAWILLRALPSAALRSRLPSRIRGRES